MSDKTNSDRHDPPGSPGARKDAAKTDPSRVGADVSDEAVRTASELRDEGREIASTVMEGADRYAREQKDAGAQQVARVARAVDRAADELEETSPELARHVHDAASSVERFSDRVRQGSVRDLIQEASDFARREPALFFGAAVIAGMALSRFLRSSAAQKTAQAGGGYHSGDGRSASATTTRRPT